MLGGLGSAITWSSGHTFVALPDRGPNAMVFDAHIDNTVSYVNRFLTITMHLKANKDDDGLPFTLSPHMQTTTLLWSAKPFLYVLEPAGPLDPVSPRSTISCRISSPHAPTACVSPRTD